ncbi:hypothetical protein BKA69DRAFT_1040388 [Paraphysoderma sedebokerense]|nr:hypothetical protein BKA69DRAFT_1040388 [Paraphysoderma sedebokerense]
MRINDIKFCYRQKRPQKGHIENRWLPGVQHAVESLKKHFLNPTNLILLCTLPNRSTSHNELTLTFTFDISFITDSAPVTPKKFPIKRETSINETTRPPIAKQIPVIKKAKEDSVAVSPRRTQLSASSHQQSSIHQNSSKLPTTKAVPIIKSTKYQNVKPKVDTKPPPVVKKPVEKDAFKKIESRSTTIVNNKKEKVNSVPPTISNKPTIPKPTTKPTPISASQATKSNKTPVKSITKPNPAPSLPTVEKKQPEQKPKPKHLSFDLKASLSKPLGYVPYTGKLKAIQKK